jgi:ABC-2 type transport system permease protein
VAYLVYGLFVAAVRLFADTAIATALLQWPQIVAQLVFTPLIAAWTIWLAMLVSARSNDIRVAQQLAMLASLPTVVVTSLIAFDVIHPTRRVVVLAAVALIGLDSLGWRMVSAAFDTERLITGTRYSSSP